MRFPAFLLLAFAWLPFSASAAEELVFQSKNQEKTITKTVWKGSVSDKLELSFAARQLALGPGDHHFGVVLQGDDKRRLMIFTRGNSLIAMIKGGLGIGDFAVPMTAGKDAKWTEFKIIIDGNFVECNVDRKLVGSFTFDILPITKIELYSNRVDLEVARFTMECGKDKAATKVGDTLLTPSFNASFDGTSMATLADGSQLAPETDAGSEFLEGLKGKAIHLGKKSFLQYDAQKLFASEAGSILFWFRPDFDGKGDLVYRNLVSGIGSDGKQKFSIGLGQWLLRASLSRKEMEGVHIDRGMRPALFKGDWLQVALTWNPEGWTKLYVDGVPYRFDCFKNEITQRFHNLDFENIKSLRVGSNMDGSFCDLRTYKRVLSEDEIVSAYRQRMPVDLAVDDSTISADGSGVLPFEVAPAGTFVQPAVGTLPPAKVSATLTASLCALDSGKVLAERSYPLELAKRQRLELPYQGIPQGRYRLLCKVSQKDGSCVQRSYAVSAYSFAKGQAASAEDIGKGELLFSKEFKDADSLKDVLFEGQPSLKSSPLGSYLEASANNGGRFSVEIPFPETALTGKPVILEVEWPDDKPRSMGLYMYGKSEKTSHHRERLEGGVQSGEEYPLTGRMQTTRYLFYPVVDSYLFEARTMINGYPAGVAKINVYAIAQDRLPKLKIERPAGLPARQFGYFDEDQTFDSNFGYYDYRSKLWQDGLATERITDMLCDYFDYTGQDAISYPVLRYGHVFYHSQPGNWGNGCFPHGAGKMGSFIRALNARGIAFIASTTFSSMPELNLMPDKTEKCEDLLSLESDGRWSSRPNILNPEVQRLYLSLFHEMAERYCKLPGVEGVEMWRTLPLGLPLSSCYNPALVAQFAKETDVAVPAGTVKEQAAFLLGPARAKWLAWRATKVADFARRIVEEIHSVKPELAVYQSVWAIGVNWASKTLTEGDLELESSDDAPLARTQLEYGFDFQKLKAIKGLYLVPMIPTCYRWHKSWGNPESVADEAIYDAKRLDLFAKDGKSFVDLFPPYFETFRKSLKPASYNCYFENADVKPFGRYFLKSLVYQVALTDAQRILIGAQPLGTLGRDAETREFAKAYGALPALPFKGIEGLTDPVAARTLGTKNGTYLYAANILWSSCSVKLVATPARPLRDLSTGVLLKPDAKGVIEVKLLPYQLRSFVAEGAVSFAKAGVEVPPETETYYKERIAALEKAFANVSRYEGDLAKTKERLERIKDLVGQGSFAEAHRLLFSKRMNQLLKRSEAAEKGFLKTRAEMLERSAYAVTCGRLDFLQTKSGKLYFPDQEFNGLYGHYGNYLTVARSIDSIDKATEEPELYLTEAYDIDGYKFKVQPGVYTVRMRFKIGYPPSGKPGVCVVNLDINGKRVLEKCDLFTANGSDFNKTFVKEFQGITPKDGLIDLAFSVPEGGSSTARACNALEIIPEK